MKKHLRVGLIFSLGVFIMLMIWGSVGMYMDAVLPNSPIAFSLQRHWLVAWTIISLTIGFIAMALVAFASLLATLIKPGN